MVQLVDPEPGPREGSLQDVPDTLREDELDMLASRRAFLHTASLKTFCWQFAVLVAEGDGLVRDWSRIQEKWVH